MSRMILGPFNSREILDIDRTLQAKKIDFKTYIDASTSDGEHAFLYESLAQGNDKIEVYLEIPDTNVTRTIIDVLKIANKVQKLQVSEPLPSENYLSYENNSIELELHNLKKYIKENNFWIFLLSIASVVAIYLLVYKIVILNQSLNFIVNPVGSLNPFLLILSPLGLILMVKKKKIAKAKLLCLLERSKFLDN